MARVLSTTEALETLQRMLRDIEGLLQQINTLNTEGQTLSNPEIWDGNKAQQFRGDWPQMHQSLLRAKEAVEQLRTTSETINRNIMTAGGN